MGGFETVGSTEITDRIGNTRSGASKLSRGKRGFEEAASGCKESCKESCEAVVVSWDVVCAGRPTAVSSSVGPPCGDGDAINTSDRVCSWEIKSRGYKRYRSGIERKCDSASHWVWWRGLLRKIFLQIIRKKDAGWCLLRDGAHKTSVEEYTSVALIHSIGPILREKSEVRGRKKSMSS